MSKPELWRHADARPLTAALRYTAAAWRVFPLHTPDARGCSCGRANCGSVGKHPRTAHGLKDARANAAIARVWWSDWPDANVGVVTGAASGILVLDVDADHGGLDSLDELVARHAGGVLPVTLTARTGGGGLHLVFAHPGGDSYLPNATRLAGLAGLDVRGDGGYIVTPPSLHVSGRRYEWLDPAADIAPLPAWLWRLVIRPRAPRPARPDTWTWPAADVAEAGQHWLAYYLPQATVGRRNEVGMLLAAQLRDAGLPRDGAEEVLAEYADRVPGDGYSDAEARATVRSVYARAPREPARRLVTVGHTNGASGTNGTRPALAPRDYATVVATAAPEEQSPGGGTDERLTDLGNAKRFVARHGASVRYVASLGQWLLWDGARWARDATAEIDRLVRDTVQHLYAAAAHIEDEQTRKETARWAIRSEGEARLNAMRNLAQAELPIAIAAERLDANGWVLNVANGLVDLRAGDLVPPRREALCTKMAGSAYDPDAECPTWEAFLARVFNDDDEMISYVRRAVGYALTGATTEQCLFVLYGTGANGKSTFLDTIGRLLGDYAMTTPMETFQVKQGTSIPSDVARLVGARFVAASESGQGRRLDEELVKRISGGDRMTARFMHRDWFEFYPVLKLFVAVNHKPTIRGGDLGIWRRIQLWPFEVTIPEEERDTALPDRLMAEGPGILAWAVRGCLEWQRYGLAPPDSVRAATADYRTEMDTIGRFLDDRCVVGADLTATSRALYDAYKAWCAEQGEREQTQTRLGLSLRERGLRKVKAASDVVWHGVGLAVRSIPPAPG